MLREFAVIFGAAFFVLAFMQLMLWFVGWLANYDAEDRE